MTGPPSAPKAPTTNALAGVGAAAPAPTTGTPAAPATIATPQGIATQSTTPDAQAALQQVQNGATVYRQGSFGVQNTSDAQYWSFRNPLATPNYARGAGMTSDPEKPDWIMGGTVAPGSPVITRESPAGPGGVNSGGDIEAVVPPGEAQNLWFYMPD